MTYYPQWQMLWDKMDLIYKTIPEEFLLEPPDGGDVKAHEAVKKMAQEIERLRGALSVIAISYSKDMPDGIDAKTMWVGCTHIARSALQQEAESK